MSRWYSLVAATAFALGVAGCSSQAEVKHNGGTSDAGSLYHPFCEVDVSNYVTRQCVDTADINFFRLQNADPRSVNQLLMEGMPTEDIRRLVSRGCNLPTYISVKTRFAELRAPHPISYAAEICTGRFALEDVLKYDPRFFTDEENFRTGAFLFLAEGVSPEVANSFPKLYTPEEVMHFIKNGMNRDVAQKWKPVKEKFRLGISAILHLESNGISPARAAWYLALEDRYPTLEIYLDVAELEAALKAGKLTRAEIERIAREEHVRNLLRKEKIDLLPNPRGWGFPN